MNSGVVLVRGVFVLLFGGFLGKAGPGLAAYWDVLAGVLGLVVKG